MKAPGREPLQAALLTPLGPAGITVVQLVGSGASALLAGLLRDSKGGQVNLQAKSGKIVRGRMVDRQGQTVDEVLVTVHRLDEPIGEAVDICCHGGVRPGEKVMEVLASAGVETIGARELPGGGFAGLVELTGGSCQGVAGEVLEALGSAQTETVVGILLEQLQGGLTAELGRLLNEGLSVGEMGQAIEILLESWRWGRRLISPAVIALAGPVNAGKSSLANLLSGQQGSIVTSQAGTTRDWVRHTGSLAGLPVVLIDTAGHRQPSDALEAEAIRRAVEQSRAADVQLLVIDGSGADFDLPELPKDSNVVLAVNKSDLAECSEDALPEELAGFPRVRTSAVNGGGLTELTSTLLKALGCERFNQGSAVVFTQRQGRCLQDALELIGRGTPSAVTKARDSLKRCQHG